MPKQPTHTTEDGWTIIGNKQKPTPPNPFPPPSFFTGPAEDKDITIVQLQADFNKKLAVWKSSKCRAQLHRILTQHRPDEGWNFTTAVVLATGNFCRDNLECRRRSMWQFVAFVDTVAFLADDGEVKMLAQDPGYFEKDYEFLRSMGVDPIVCNRSGDNAKKFCPGRWDEEPWIGPAEDHLGPQSVLFEFFMEFSHAAMRAVSHSGTILNFGTSHQHFHADRADGYVKHRADMRAWPYGYYREVDIENDVKRNLKISEQYDDFLQSRRALKFPYFEEDPTVFEGLMIYVKEEQDEDDSEGEKHETKGEKNMKDGEETMSEQG